MAKNKETERFLPYFDLFFATCCTSLSVEDATARMNAVNPTGIKSKWQLAPKDQWPEGLVENPWPCDDEPNWKHMFFVC